MAKKPPICLSKVPPIIPITNALKMHLVWTNGDPAYPPMLIDETVTLVQTTPGGADFEYLRADQPPNKLFIASGYFPFATPYNYIELHVRDSAGAGRDAGCYFSPDRPPPFDQVVTADWFHDLPLDTIVAHFMPA